MIRFTLAACLFASAVAGAQTVTVGTTSSTQNGNTTTITLPVNVALPAGTTTTTAATMNSLRVEIGSWTGYPINQSFTTSFKTISLSNVIIDTASAWNSGTSTYTVPITGTYLVISNLRLIDQAPAGISYGQGVHTSNIDNTTFVWNTTSGLRNGSSVSRVMQLSAGQTVDFFAYVDSGTPLAIAGASLTIQQLN